MSSVYLGLAMLFIYRNSELELDHLSIEEPILPQIVKTMTSLTALSLIGSPIDKESFHKLFTQRSTLREVRLAFLSVSGLIRYLNNSHFICSFASRARTNGTSRMKRRRRRPTRRLR